MNTKVFDRQRLETSLLNIWRTRLEKPELDIDVTFTEAGGDSLAAMMLLADIEKTIGFRLAPRDIILAPSIRDQVELMMSVAAAAVSDNLAETFVTLVQAGQARAPLFIVPGYGDALIGIRALADQLLPQQPVYVLDPAGFKPQQHSFATLGELAAAMIASMRRIQPEGPYHLCGHSLGAYVAWEVARQLLAAGEPPGRLLLLDANAPGYPVRQPRVVRALRKLGVASLGGPVRMLELFRSRLQRGFDDVLRGTPPLFDSKYALELGAAAHALEASWRVVLALGESHKAMPYNATLHVIRAEFRATEIGVIDDDPALGWNAFAPAGVTVLSIGCDHTHILHSHHAQALGRLITVCLESLPDPQPPGAKALAERRHDAGNIGPQGMRQLMI